MNGWRDIDDAQLGRALEELGGCVDYPTGAGLALAVRARLEAESGETVERPARGRSFRRQWRGRPTGWQLVGLTAGLLLVLLLVLSVSPSARHAVADWLGLRGVEIHYGDRPTGTSAAAGATLGLGERVDLAEARRRAPFPLLLPPESHTGPPDEVYLSPTRTGPRVSFLWLSDERLAPAPGSDVGMLLTQFRASVDDAYIRKLLHGGVRVQEVQVAGGRGYWFEGAPHPLLFSDERGQFFEESSRLAGNTLVWERGDLTLRLESALSREEAIRLAESLR